MEQSNLDEPKDSYSEESRKDIGVTTEKPPPKRRKIFFETKTLAEVYAKQGHTMIALEIYKRIFQKNPSDSEAQKRILELETKLFPGRKNSQKLKTIPHER